MGIPIEVVGLSSIVSEVPDGRLLIIEGGADPAKSFLLRRLALTAATRDYRVSFITSRDRAELVTLLGREGGTPEWKEDRFDIEERDSVWTLDEFGANGGLLAVDSFSFLTLDLTPSQLAGMLRSLRAICQERHTTVLLGTERGMVEGRAEAVTWHLADGVIQFHTKEGPEGVIRWLRIPKWMDGKALDRNIYYGFDGARLTIDLRRRVL